MLNLRKDHRVKYVTMLFLAVFVLLKVTQYYSLVPIISRRNELQLNAGGNAYSHLHQLSFLWVMDKCVLEVKDDTTIPKIKFAGTVLYLTFSGLLITLLQRRKVYPYQAHYDSDHHSCTTLCTFRL